MNENFLTGKLVANLEAGEIKKIVKSRINRTSIKYYREIGENSFRADIFISLNQEVTNKRDFIAIEVKIKDWKQGLYQAWRYNSFAKKSYLAILDKHIKNVDIKLFKEYNVGLISFNETEVKVLNQPKVNLIKKNTYSYDLKKRLEEKILLV